MAHLRRNYQRAFTLLEIVLTLGIIAVIFFFSFRLGKSFDDHSDLSETRMRMEEIVKSAKAYYMKHGDLPFADFIGGVPGGIPLGAGGLDIDPKFRFDGWQRPMRYISYTNDGEEGRPGEIQVDELSFGAPAGAPSAMVVIPEQTRTLIRAIEFEGRRVAGLIISSGSDEVFNYSDPVQVSVDYGYSPMEYRPGQASDDIFMPIDLTSEATRIAIADLKVLNEKVKAFDDRYLGVDNNENGQYDERGCEGIPYVINPDPFPGIPDPFTNCSQLNFPFINPVYYPPPTRFPPATLFDINCGRPTLDFMKANFCPLPEREGCIFGYFEPEIQPIPPVPNPENPETNCPGTPRAFQPADYARFPFVRGVPGADNCHWGLIETLYGNATTPEPNETDADQARAFIFCLFKMSPNAIIDPWLNGYVWGCGSNITLDVRGGQRPGCEYVYASDEPRYHRFFSAGPNGVPLRLEEALGLEPEDQDDIIP